MKQSLALELAKRWVKTPKFVKGRWIVEWLDRTIIKKEAYCDWSEASASYNQLVHMLKKKISTHGRK